MDTEPEELQFLGFLGIIREAHKIILPWRKLFSQITLALILPLSFIFLVHIEITSLLFTKINKNEEALEDTPAGSPSQDKILNRLASEWTAFVLFKAVYLVGVLVFSLLSTSAVVYTVACVYTAKDTAFGKIMSVVPKVWKRLMITFLWNFGILLGYNAVAVLIILLFLLISGTGAAGVVVLVFLAIFYLVGLVYISVTWHLASVLSVLEDQYGIAAMRKSKALIKGKAWIASVMFLLFNLLFVTIEILFRKLVVHGGSRGLGARVWWGGLILCLLSVLILIGLVVQTVIYFVCKSYHHESIDKSSLADHLEVYLGEYVPLKGRDVQLEQYYV